MRRSAVIFFFGLIPVVVWAAHVSQQVFQLHAAAGQYDVDYGCSYRAPQDQNFTIYHGTLSLGFRHTALEIQCRIMNHGVRRLMRLVIAAPWLDYIEFSQSGRPGKSIAGELVPVSSRAAVSRNPSFPVELPEGETVIMLKIDSPGARMVLPIELADETDFLTAASKENWILGVFFGFVACLAVISVVFGAYSSDAIFFIYALGLVANLALLFIQFGMPGCLLGITGNYLNTLTGMLTGLSAGLFTEFHRRYLRSAGSMSLVLKIAALTGGVVALLFLVLPFSQGVRVSLYHVIIVDVLLLVMLLARLRRGEIQYSAFYLAAWLVFLAGILLHLLTIFGVVPAHTATRTAYPVAFLLQSLLFTLALGSKHRELLEQEKNARLQMKLIEQEYCQARDIHRRLLPDAMPRVDGLSMDILYIPMGELGGDFYTYQECPDGSWIFLIADVQGHGLPAALDASSVKLAFNEAVSKDCTPGNVLSEMNRLLSLHLRNRFMSAQVLRWVPSHRKMQIASAGHPYPLLFDRAQQACRELRAEGSILGLYPEASYRDIEITLQARDFLLVYTDGLIEDPASSTSYEEDISNLMAVMKKAALTLSPDAAFFAGAMPAYRVSPSWSDDVTAFVFAGC